MKEASLRRIHQIFDSACGLSGIEREQFLDRECHGQLGLRESVESLLRHYDDIAQGDAPEGDDAASMGLSPVPSDSNRDLPERLGSYRILERLGSGGMGVVYLAEQESPHREVALKVLHPAQVSDLTRRRLELEAEALGRLKHPGIAQIFESESVPTETGPQHLIVMEYVEDRRSLMAFARQKDLSRRRRIELLIDICDAIAHAHQRGVIHRDLKPDNILIDGSGSPKVLDFGIARVIDSRLRTSLETRAGDIVGTLEYMSPEQAAGDPSAIDIRTDVYSLGLVGFELLTGRKPRDLSRKGVQRALRSIADSDPPPLGRIDPRLRGDLETIFEKALARDKERRYGSVSDFAEDLRRYLAERPILAHPPSTWYRLSKFVRRHRAGVAVGLAILAAALGSSVAGFDAWQHRNLARRMAAENETLAIEVKALNRQGGELRAALDDRNDLVEGAAMTTRILAGNDDPTVQQITRRLRDSLESFRTGPGSQYARGFDVRLTEATLALAEEDYSGVLDLFPKSQVDSLLDDPVLALRLRGEALYRLERWRDALDSLDRAVLLLDDDPKTQFLRGLALGMLGRHAEAVQAYERAAEIAPPTPATLFNLGSELMRCERFDEAVSAFDRALERRPDRVEYLEAKGLALHLGRRHEEAIEALGKAIDLDPASARSHFTAGNAHLALDRTDAALNAFRKAIEADPAHEGAHFNLALTLYRRGEQDEALQWIEACLALRPAMRSFRLKGQILGRLERYEEAARAYAEAIRKGPGRADLYNSLGTALHGAGRVDEALEAFEKALDLKPDHPLAIVNSAIILNEREQTGEAEELARRAVGLWSEDASAWFELGRALVFQEKRREAVEALSRVVQLQPSHLAAHRLLGTSLAELGRFEEALAPFQRARELEPRNVINHMNLALTFKKLQRPQEALRAYDRAVEVAPNACEPRSARGRLLFQLNQFERAHEDLAVAADLCPDRAGSHLELGMAFQQLELLDEAESEYRRALEIDPRLEEAKELLKDIQRR